MLVKQNQRLKSSQTDLQFTKKTITSNSSKVTKYALYCMSVRFVFLVSRTMMCGVKKKNKTCDQMLIIKTMTETILQK